MTPKEKAEELIKKYSDFVSGYIGSSMLTNTEYPEAILNNAKKCTLIAVDELIEDNKTNEELVNGGLNKQYWEEVKTEIELL
jgi:hypothetical protein